MTGFSLAQLPEKFDASLSEFLLFPLESDHLEPPAPCSDPRLNATERSLFLNINEIPPSSSHFTNDHKQTDFRYPRLLSKFTILNTPSKDCLDTAPHRSLDKSFPPLAPAAHSQFHPLRLLFSELESIGFTGTTQAEKPGSSSLPFVRLTELPREFPVSMDQIPTLPLAIERRNHNIIPLNVVQNGMFRRTGDMELSGNVKIRYSFSFYSIS